MTGRFIIVAGALILGPIASACLTTASAEPATSPLNSWNDIFGALERCWIPPPLEKSRPGTQITVMITLNRSGEVMGEPRFTFITPGTPPEIRTAYQLSVANAISRCTPMPLTQALGGAVAGRPFTIRYQDIRGQKGADKSWLKTTTS